jgi:CDP-diglyceride synthetase
MDLKKHFTKSSKESLENRLSTTLFLFICLMIANNRLALSTEIIFFFVTLLMWFGIGFVVIKLITKKLKQQFIEKSKKNIYIFLSTLLIMLLYLSPIILYLLAKGII